MYVYMYIYICVCVYISILGISKLYICILNFCILKVLVHDTYGAAAVVKSISLEGGAWG